MTLSLESSGLTSTIFLDPRHLSLDIPHAPNMSHGQLFSWNTSLLMDCMQDMCMTPDSSPVVSASMTICTWKTSLFSPLECVVFSHRSSAYSCFRRTNAGQWRDIIHTITNLNWSPETEDQQIGESESGAGEPESDPGGGSHHMEDTVHDCTVSFIDTFSKQGLLSSSIGIRSTNSFRAVKILLI